MKEFNRKTLVEALSSLPQYHPPEEVWTSIEEAVELTGMPYQKSLKSLPEYEPPSEVWEKITQHLPSGKVRRLIVRRTLAAAASIVLLITAGLLLDNFYGAEQDFTISYSTETVDAALVGHNWNEDEDVFEEFDQLCKNREYICARPEFIELKSELDELTDAKYSLVSALGKYGANADIITQLKEIELERTDLLKKLMVMLI